MMLTACDVLAHTFQGFSSFRGLNQAYKWFFEGTRDQYMVKGICSQDIFLGIGKFSNFFPPSGLSQLPAFEESVGGYAQCREG
jgi:hypothetical protein